MWARRPLHPRHQHQSLLARPSCLQFPIPVTRGFYKSLPWPHTCVSKLKCGLLMRPPCMTTTCLAKEIILFAQTAVVLKMLRGPMKSLDEDRWLKLEGIARFMVFW